MALTLAPHPALAAARPPADRRPADRPPTALPRAAVAAVLRRPSLLVALTVLLVCVPTGEENVTAAVHITPADLASLALVGLLGVDLLRGRPRR